MGPEIGERGRGREEARGQRQRDSEPGGTKQAEQGHGPEGWRRDRRTEARAGGGRTDGRTDRREEAGAG